MRAATDVVELVGDTEEVWAINLIYLGVWRNLEGLKVLTMQAQVVVVRWVEFVGEGLHRGGLVGTLDEKDDRQQQSHLDSDREVEEHGQNERHNHHQEIRLRVLGKPYDGAPLRHIITHHDQYTRQTRHRYQSDQRTKEQQYRHEHNSVHDTCHRGLATVVDIGHGTRDSTRSWDTAKEWHHHVRHTLSYQLGVGVVSIAYHTICHHSRQEGLNSAQHRDGESRREKTLHQAPEGLTLCQFEGWQVRRGNAVRNGIEVADSLDALHARITAQQPCDEGHHNDNHQ